MVKCAKCSRVVNEKSPGVQCGKCNKWHHATCAALTTEQLCALSIADSVDWKCRTCAPIKSGGKKRISLILPDCDNEDSENEAAKIDSENILSELRKEIRQLRKTVKDIIEEELKTTLDFYSSKIDEFETRFNDQETRVKLLENKYTFMENTCKNLTLKNEVLEQKLHKSEQAQASNDVEVCGISEVQNEDVKKIASTIGQLLNQDPCDVIRAVRKKKPSRLGSAQAERAKMDAPVTITLREGRREQWCEAARSAQITNKDVGGEGNRRVYLREVLTPTTAFLLWKTKAELREKSICKYVWCRNGQIMVRKVDGDKKIYYVRAEKDIERIAKELQR